MIWSWILGYMVCGFVYSIRWEKKLHEQDPYEYIEPAALFFIGLTWFAWVLVELREWMER